METHVVSCNNLESMLVPKQKLKPNINKMFSYSQDIAHIHKILLLVIFILWWKVLQILCLWTHLWVEQWRDYIVPPLVMRSVYREKCHDVLFLHEHKTHRLNNWSSGSEACGLFIMSFVCTQSALLEKTTMTVNKRMVAGIWPTCHFTLCLFTLSWRKGTPNICTQHDNVTQPHTVKYLTH